MTYVPWGYQGMSLALISNLCGCCFRTSIAALPSSGLRFLIPKSFIYSGTLFGVDVFDGSYEDLPDELLFVAEEVS